LAALFSASLLNLATAAVPDPRLREVVYDPHAVLTVPVRRGEVTLVVLASDEAIKELAAGLGGDCSKADATWCIAAQPGGRHIFIKPKSAASGSNTLAVVTDRRLHTLSLFVLDEQDRRPPVYRLLIKAPVEARAAARPALPVAAHSIALPPVPPPPSPQQVVAERLQAKPQVANTQYSLAEGAGAHDIVPTLVFDDGRFTYMRLPGHRELPAVFQVLGDGSEALANVRMEDDLLVVDRVSRRLMLRAGSSAVGIWNEAFDPDGVPPEHGTTVPGVRRVLNAAGRSPGTTAGGTP
jgi:type IV secretion system protein VirB9